MNRALIVLFVVIITLPMAGTLAGVDGGDREAENRELAAFPHWDRTWASTRAYPDAFASWFEDHFAFRADLVRWYAESRLFGLGVSPSSAVLKGEDQWLYYGDDGGVLDYANATPLTPGEVGAWREALDAGARLAASAAASRMSSRSRPTSTSSIRSTCRRPSASSTPTSRTDQIYAALAGSGVSTVELRTALLQAKTRERLFYLTDTHWNDRGALVAYQQIIDAVRAQVPATPAAWTREDFDATEERDSGQGSRGHARPEERAARTGSATGAATPRGARASSIRPAPR